MGHSNLHRCSALLQNHEETPTSAQMSDEQLHLSDEAPADTDNTTSLTDLPGVKAGVKGRPHL